MTKDELEAKLDTTSIRFRSTQAATSTHVSLTVCRNPPNRLENNERCRDLRDEAVRRLIWKDQCPDDRSKGSSDIDKQNSARKF